MEQDLLERFWRGECSKDEVRRVLKWFNSIDSEIHFGDNIDYIWHHYEKDNLPQQLKEVAFSKIQKNISDRYGDDLEIKDHSLSRKFTLAFFIRIAAVFIALIIALGVVKHLTNDEFPVDPQAETMEWIERTTRSGQKLTVFLNDGSKVVLNAGSTIRYAEKYIDSSRELYLEGEAFFDVARDTLKPFIVHTGDIATTALGTSFNVRSYPDETEIKIALVTGKVVVNSREITDINHVLIHGEGVVYNKQTFKHNKYRFDPAVAISWKDGKLYFKDATNQQIFSELEKWYGVEIDIKKRLNSKLYTGEFNNLSLEEVLTGLSYVKEFSFEINNRNVIIK